VALNPDLPEEVGEVVRSLLEPKADKRLSTCDELLQRLDQVRG